MRKNIVIYFSIFLILLVLNILTKPHYLNYTDSIRDITISDDTLKLSFSNQVSAYEVVKYENEIGHTHYEISAYKRLLNFNKANDLTIENLNQNSLVYFASFDGRLDHVIYGRSPGNFMTLPRLALNYYTMIIFGLTILMTLAYALFKPARKIITNILLILIAYLCAAFINTSLSNVVINLQRELMVNIILAISLSSLFISLNHYRMRIHTKKGVTLTKKQKGN